jgi:hypothetical protein
MKRDLHGIFEEAARKAGLRVRRVGALMLLEAAPKLRTQKPARNGAHAKRNGRKRPGA